MLRAVNIGNGPVEGEAAPLTIKDALPTGLTAVAITGKVRGWFLNGLDENKYAPHGTVKCVLATLTCTYDEDAVPFSVIEVVITVNSSPGAESGPNTMRMFGGDAPAVSRSQLVRVSEAELPFGVESESYQLALEEENGISATQAGGHPFQMTTSLVLNDTGVGSLQPAQPRDEVFDLPAGLVGDAQATAQCSLAQFDIKVGEGNGCAPDTAIGVAVVWLAAAPGEEPETAEVPVFNLVPGYGEPARFGLFPQAPVVIDTSLRSGSDYGVVATVPNTSEGVGVMASSVTIWGNPGSPAHDNDRGWRCVELSKECVVGAEEPQNALLRVPTACQALSAPMSINSWSDPTLIGPIESSLSASLDGCNREQFEPTISVTPATAVADSTTGLNVDVRIPQEAGEDPGEIAQADVRNTTVALPADLQVNPAVAAGLTGCTTTQIGFLGIDKQTGRALFSDETEAEHLGEVPHTDECPETSRIGKVTVHTRLLPEPLTGYVYQAAQNDNPFGSLLAVYVVAEDPKAGVRVRLAGEVKVQSDGQLVSTFNQTPQVPFEEFSLEFSAGPKAPLASTGCGTYTTTSSMEPWSSVTPGEVVAHPESHFNITNGPENTPCANLNTFAPTFSAGTTNNQAGAYTTLRTTILRQDTEGDLSTVAVTMPPGLAGVIANVTPCPEPGASTGQCPAASKIGHVQVTTGIGSQPIQIPQPGKPEDPVYLTGPYQGAPYGLTIAVPAEAGPFNLDENNQPVIVRAKINVNPRTAQVSIESQPMPTRLQGIPLDVRSVEVIIDRPSFALNPTSCASMSITATVASNEGATHQANSHYQAANCTDLPFKPSFQVEVHAQHTRRYGAYLHSTITQKAGEDNIKSVYIELPKILPSRQETLTHACSQTQFNSNPAGCPPASYVGTATAHTTLLPAPLTGPAILVSHGGAGFPDLTLVLQGNNITIDQTGTVNIVKGITSTNFETIPDAPISSIELTLPTGLHSILAATTNLCTTTTIKRTKTKVLHGKAVLRKHRVIQKRAIAMPTVIAAQNGAVIHQQTPINVTGCPTLHKMSDKNRGNRVLHTSALRTNRWRE